VSGRLPLALPALLKANGLHVVEIDGWQTRGAATLDPKVILRHHTAGPSGGGDLPSKNVLVNGRPDLSGPLCQIALGRSGTVYTVASGKANHAGAGSWLGISQNFHAVGVEAENDGVQPWPQVQLDAWDVLDALLLRLIAQPASHLCAHREWATPPGRKTDPHSMPMDAVRDRVARLMHNKGAVVPDYNPPIVMPPIVSSVVHPDGVGIVQLGDDGSLWAFPPDKVRGFRGVNGQPYWGNRKAAQLRLGPDAKHPLTIIATTAEDYSPEQG
jgi:hypothetical protein